MNLLPAEILRSYRSRTYRISPELRIASPDAAVQFVNERGFIFFWPAKETEMPSLWTSVAGSRPVADGHDDPGHVTWGWKDSLLGKKRWYYGRILRRRNTIISLTAAPFFYTLSENYGSPEDDYLVQYEEGRLTQEAKLVYEALLREGPLDTIALRKSARLTSADSTTRFNRALDDLQKDFKILPIKTAEVGAWKYAFVYELTARHHPEIVEEARFLTERAARRKLAELYLRSLGAASQRDFAKLFGWTPAVTAQAADDLVAQGLAQPGWQIEEQKGEVLVISDLLQ